MTLDALFYGSVWFFQVLGILVVVLARLSSGGYRQVVCERCVFGFVLMLGVATMTAIWLASPHWLSLALSLCVISIAATIHVRPATASI
ncbi:MAG: hypothetical protein KDA83_09415 [Planctomycetales bacterium]|nr:hypothetical protein [Planctomycetales bacterium]